MQEYHLAVWDLALWSAREFFLCYPKHLSKAAITAE
jgi:hypothetical protein